MSPAEPSSRHRHAAVLAAALLGLAVLVAFAVWAGLPEMVETARNVAPESLLVPVGLGLLSYAAMARSYQGIAQAAGAHLDYGSWVRITFVSNTVNYIVTSGGLSGFAVRMLLLARHGVASGRAVVISLVQTVLTNFTLLIFILAGFVSLALRREIQGAELWAASGFIVAFAAVLVYAVVLVVNRRLRRLTLFFLTHRAHQALHRIAPRWTPRRQRLLRFRRNLNQGFDFLLERKDRIVAPVAWIVLDWILTLAILWWAFRSLNNPVPPAVVLIGFGVGVIFSLVSLVPGGIGIMEGSMTAVFQSLGVPRQVAFLASIVFRISYHVVPLLVSVLMFRGLFRQAVRSLDDPPGV